MTDTAHVIEQLSARAVPVRRMSSPLRRTLVWLAAALLVTVVMVYTQSGGEGLARVLASPDATREWLASLLTGVLASYAVFQVSVPGRDPRWAWLPLPAALLWLASIGWGCMNEVARDGFAALAFHSGPMECLRAISMTSIPLGLVLLLLVRHAGVVRPRPTALLAMLSAAALSSSAVSLIHDGGESSLMVLIWHIGAVAVLSLASLLCARRLFAWIGYSRHA